MNWSLVSSIIFLLAFLFAGNYYYLKIPLMPFIGLSLLALLILSFAITFFKKRFNKSKGVEGEPNAFIFPDNIARGMKKMDVAIQYESSVLSSALLIVGIILFTIYYVFFTSSNWVIKSLIIFNCVCGIGLMGGMMITYYHQLIAYRESTAFINQYSQNSKAPEDLNEGEQYEDGQTEQELYDNKFERREIIDG